MRRDHHRDQHASVRPRQHGRARRPARPQEELFFDVIGRDQQIIGGGISEPETGGDWGYFATKARREGESYILNGRKTFTSLSPVIDLFMVMATIEDSDPPPPPLSSIPRGTPGLRTGRDLGRDGDAGDREPRPDDQGRARARGRDGGVAAGRSRLNDQAISLFAWFGLSVAAVYTGIAIAALKFAKEFAGRLKPLTLPRPIKYLPGIQFAIAEAEALIAQSRALYLGIARDYIGDRESFKGEAGLARVVMPKYVATNNAIRPSTSAWKWSARTGC